MWREFVPIRFGSVFLLRTGAWSLGLCGCDGHCLWPAVRWVGDSAVSYAPCASSLSVCGCPGQLREAQQQVDELDSAKKTMERQQRLRRL